MSSEKQDEVISRISKYAKNVAVVGISAKTDRPSHRIMMYLKERGFNVIPISPIHTEIGDLKAYPSLRDIPDDIEIHVVSIFRKPEDVVPVVDAAIERGVKAVWMQSGIVNNEAAKKAREHGLDVVMDKCIKVEHRKRG